MERREFISWMMGLAAVGAAIPKSLSDQKRPEMEEQKNFKNDTTIEWGTHLFSSDLQKYPFHPQATYQPDAEQLPKDPLKVYLDQLEKSGIDKAVVVQPEPYGDDHSLILDSLDRAPGRLKGTSLFYPKDPEAPQKLNRLIKQNPNIVSTRFHAHRGKESYLDTFDDPGVRALWSKAVDLDLIVELHIGPNYAQQVNKAIKAFPGCKVIIDHFGEPQMGNAVEYASMLDLAGLPNVYMKFSGITHFANDAPSFESALPFVQQVAHAYGPDKMVMGGVSLMLIDSMLADFTTEQRAKVKGQNLMNLLNWT